MNTVIYLSGSIANLSENQARGWRDEVKRKYPYYEYRDPARRIYDEHHTDDKEIVIGDKIDMDQSDVFLVNLTQYSAGTIMEIYHGFINNKMVLVVNSMNMADSQISPWIRYHATKIFPSIDTAMDYLSQYNNLILDDTVRALSN